MTARLAVSLSTLLLISGCGDELPLKQLPPEMTLESYASPTKLVWTRSIDFHDPVYVRLRDLLTKEQDGWNKDFVSYAPGPYVFRSSGYTIRCFASFLVIDYSESGHAISVRKNIPAVLQQLGLPSGNYHPDNQGDNYLPRHSG
jgi:hypothetical protein